MLYFKKKNIIWEKLVFYTEKSNRIIKCSICIIIEKVYIILINVGLLAKLWSKTLSIKYYIINRLLTKALQRKMPFKVWYKNKSNLFNLYIYDCDTYVVDYKAKTKRKMVSCLWTNTFIGYKAKN